LPATIYSRFLQQIKCSWSYLLRKCAAHLYFKK